MGECLATIVSTLKPSRLIHSHCGHINVKIQKQLLLFMTTVHTFPRKEKTQKEEWILRNFTALNTTIEGDPRKTQCNPYGCHTEQCQWNNSTMEVHSDYSNKQQCEN